MEEDMGALSGSREPSPSSTGLGPSGFDPARKAWPLCGYAPGNYMGKCYHCNRQFEGDKRALECLECAAASANGLMEIYRAEVRGVRDREAARESAMIRLIDSAATFWGNGSEQHNLIKNIADTFFASAGEAFGRDGETRLDAEHEHAVPEGQTPNSCKNCNSSPHQRDS